MAVSYPYVNAEPPLPTGRLHLLRASEIRYRRLFEAARDGILLVDPVSRQILDANPFMTELLGYSHAEFLGKELWQIGLLRDEEASRAMFRDLQESRYVRYDDLPLQTKSGRCRDVEFVSNVYHENDSDIIQCNIRDITEKKRLDQRLLLLESGVANLRDIILITEAAPLDEPGPRIIFANQALEHITGYSVAESLGRSPRFLQGPETDPTALADIRHALKHHQPINRQLLNYRRDGSTYWMDVDIVPIHDSARKCTHFAAIERDVTDERLRQEELAQALVREHALSREAQAGERAKSEFLATMSHEIRTPMNAILGFSELLAHTESLPVECRSYVDTITSSGEALLRILNDILDYSRLEANGLQTENAPFCPRTVLQDVHTLLTPLADTKGIPLVLAIDPSISDQICNDRGRLSQILINLTNNAIKFTGHGTITLGARPSQSPPQDGIEFFVRDSGVGIPQDDLEAIFRPFVQLSSPESPHARGTGLGLSISRHLIDLMHGTLTVESQSGVGSTFRVTLPDLAHPSPESTTPAAHHPPFDTSFARSYPLSILVAEDDSVSLRLIQTLLEKLGYHSRVAHDGIEAIAAFHQERPDCILMDLQMPGRDGLEATAEIRRIESTTPLARPATFISALTANIIAEDQQNCFLVGMDAYLNKPIRRPLLAETLIRAHQSRSVRESSSKFSGPD